MRHLGCVTKTYTYCYFNNFILVNKVFFLNIFSYSLNRSQCFFIIGFRHDSKNFFTARSDRQLPELPDALLYAIRDTAGNAEDVPLSLATKITKQGDLYRFDYASPFLCRTGKFAIVLDEDRLSVAGDPVVAVIDSAPLVTRIAVGIAVKKTNGRYLPVLRWL